MWCAARRHACWVGLLGAAIAVSGCSWFNALGFRWGGSEGSQPIPRDALAAPGAVPPPITEVGDDETGPVVLAMHFDVLRVDLPVGEIRHSLKVWNHLEESIGDPGQTALLARNGLRIGVGDESAWPAMRLVFEGNDARSTRAAHIASDGLGLVVPLGDTEDGATYFLHRRSGELQGGAFGAGRMILLVDYEADANDPSRVRLTITPEFREHKSRTRIVQQGGEIVTVHDQEGVVFHELAAAVTVEPGQFVVVASSTNADGGYLLGSRWLNSELDMQKYETVLCINVQVARTE